MSIRHVVTIVLATWGLLAGCSTYPQQAQKDDHDSHHPGETGKPQAFKPAPPNPRAGQPDGNGVGGGMDMGMMDSKMKSMKEQMQRIHAAKDPVERKRLMDEHMASMQKMMSGMKGMMGGAAKAGAPSPGAPMDTLEPRMTMMQGMMEQMMERMMEYEK